MIYLMNYTYKIINHNVKENKNISLKICLSPFSCPPLVLTHAIREAHRIAQRIRKVSSSQ